MGLSKAKSCITVRGEMTFLDVIMNQLEVRDGDDGDDARRSTRSIAALCL